MYKYPVDYQYKSRQSLTLATSLHVPLAQKGMGEEKI